MTRGRGKPRPSDIQIKRELVTAIIEDDVLALEDLLREKAPVNFKLEVLGEDEVWRITSMVNIEVAEAVASWTPLHLACYLGNAEAADLLLRARARIGTKDLLGREPFDYAPNNHEFQELRGLVEKQSGEHECDPLQEADEILISEFVYPYDDIPFDYELGEYEDHEDGDETE